MAKTNNAVVLDFPKKTKQAQKRKRGINVNKDGSVRNINGKIYVDFYYLGERVRETSGLPYNDSNLKTQVSHPQHMSNSLITISIVSKTSPNLAEAGRDRWSLFTVAARNWRK